MDTEKETIEFEDDSDQERIKEEKNAFESLNSYAVGNSVRTIIDMIDHDIIYLKPDFQREFIWDIRRASKLIDSIIIGLPIPNTMLAKYKKSEKFIIVEGQQRLKSIYVYIKGEFNDNGTVRPFKLRGLDEREWDGKLFSELDEVLQRRIYNTVINSTILDNIDSKPKIVFEIFHLALDLQAVLQVMLFAH